MLSSTEEARQYFKPLTYSNLESNDFIKLIAILERHLGIWNEQVLTDRIINNHDNRYHMIISHKKKLGTCIVYDNRRKNPFKGAYIKVLCDNYSLREGISFNSDGFIGFAGWSDSDNVKPFLNAFEEWVNWKKKSLEYGEIQ